MQSGDCHKRWMHRTLTYLFRPPNSQEQQCERKAYRYGYVWSRWFITYGTLDSHDSRKPCNKLHYHFKQSKQIIFLLDFFTLLSSRLTDNSFCEAKQALIFSSYICYKSLYIVIIQFGWLGQIVFSPQINCSGLFSTGPK